MRDLNNKCTTPYFRLRFSLH